MEMNSIFSDSPARKIGILTRSVSGSMPDMGIYESSLERDMMELVRASRLVTEFFPQPLTISYLNEHGQTRTYTPDGLIKFEPEAQMRPILYEVKHREDFRKDWKILMPKFRAAKSHCLAEGWRFEVYTEAKIRGPFLENIRFLRNYIDRAPSVENKQMILKFLWELDDVRIDAFLCSIYGDKTNRAKLLPHVWHLIGEGTIGCDLDSPLTMSTQIYPLQDADHESY